MCHCPSCFLEHWESFHIFWAQITVWEVSSITSLRSLTRLQFSSFYREDSKVLRQANLISPPFSIQNPVYSLPSKSIMAEPRASQDRQEVIGDKNNFWLYSKEHGFDLTHPSTPESPQTFPRITLQTINTPITITPSKAALVVIDMQNFFLSKALSRKGEGHAAQEALLKYAILAAREVGIQIIWLTWGLTEEDLNSMSPSMLRCFKFDEILSKGGGPNLEVPRPGEESQYKELWTNGGMGSH